MKKNIKKSIILFIFCIFNFNYVFAENSSYSELHFAVLRNDPVKAIQSIQENPAIITNFDREGQTALHLAIKRNNLLVLKAMLDKDLNINPNIKNKNGETPLLYASKLNNLNAAKILLEKDVDIYSQDLYGKDSLYFSNLNENETLTKMLLSKLNSNKNLKINSLADSEEKYKEEQINEAMKKVKLETLTNSKEESSEENSLPFIEKNNSSEEDRNNEINPVNANLKDNILDSKEKVEEEIDPSIVFNEKKITEIENQKEALNKKLNEKESEILKLQKQLKATQEAQMVSVFNEPKIENSKEILLFEPNKKNISDDEQNAIMFNGYTKVTGDLENIVNENNTIIPNNKESIVEKKDNNTETIESANTIPEESKEVSKKENLYEEQKNIVKEDNVIINKNIKEKSSIFNLKFISSLFLIFSFIIFVYLYVFKKIFHKKDKESKEEKIKAILNKQSRYNNDR